MCGDTVEMRETPLARLGQVLDTAHPSPCGFAIFPTADLVEGSPDAAIAEMVLKRIDAQGCCEAFKGLFCFSSRVG